MSGGRVIVVGSVNVDLVIGGERLPSPGETVVGDAFEQHHGGKGGNQAVAAARLGRPVLFVGAVGDDEFGRESGPPWPRARRRVGARRRSRGRPTGVALILVDRRGENIISVAPGCQRRVAIRRLWSGRRSSGSGSTPATSVLVCHESPTATVREALRLGRAGRRDDDPQPGSGRRDRPNRPGPGRCHHPEPGRAADAGGHRRAAIRAGSRARAPRRRPTSGVPPGRCSSRRRRGRASAGR